MKIEVVGAGCARCKALALNTAEAVAELGIDAEIRKVTDIQEIAAKGVFMTPALIVDDKVVASGRVPSARQIREMLE